MKTPENLYDLKNPEEYPEYIPIETPYAKKYPLFSIVRDLGDCWFESNEKLLKGVKDEINSFKKEFRPNIPHLNDSQLLTIIHALNDYKNAMKETDLIVGRKVGYKRLIKEQYKWQDDNSYDSRILTRWGVELDKLSKEIMEKYGVEIWHAGEDIYLTKLFTGEKA